jgi:hypothetical protein
MNTELGGTDLIVNECDQICILILDGAPHPRTHNGKEYNLTSYGLKNYNKLFKNGQLERGVPEKKCVECHKIMIWRIDGPLRKPKNGTYTYQPRHNGKCIKKGFSDENNLINNAKVFMVLIIETKTIQIWSTVLLL